MPKLKDDQIKQWYGEIKFHFYGYIGWDLKDNVDLNNKALETLIDNYLSKCISVELNYIDGSVDDIGHGLLSNVINSISKILGNN